jgi:DNA-directed RNA polymerase subunit A'
MAKENTTHIASVKFSGASEKFYRELADGFIVSSVYGSSDTQGTVKDSRFGPSSKSETCSVCKIKGECTGHWGIIELPFPVLNPFYEDTTCNVIRCICTECNQFKIAKQTFDLYPERFNSFKKVVAYANGLNICETCRKKQPKTIRYSPKECEFVCSKDFDNKRMSSEAIYDMFSKIPKDELKKFKNNDPEFHPCNYFFTVFPVPPMVCRASSVINTNDKKLVAESDITTVLNLVVSLINKLKEEAKQNANPNPNSKKKKKVDSPESLKQKIGFHLFGILSNQDNSHKNNMSQQPTESIRHMLSKKEGILRHNTATTRVTNSARAPITGSGADLSLTQIGVPTTIAKQLLIPVRVGPHNLKECEKMVKNGQAVKYQTDKTVIDLDFLRAGVLFPRLLPGDLAYPNPKNLDEKNFVPDCEGVKIIGNEPIPVGYMIKRGNVFIKRIRKVMETNIEIGGTIFRSLKNGDVVAINRQPTLTAKSILVCEVAIVDGHTFKLNPLVCDIMNADFDGDEINIYAPNSPDEEADFRELLHVKHCMLSPKNGGATFFPIQDCMISVWKMTENGKHISPNLFYDILMKIKNFDYSKIAYIKSVLGEEKYFTGHSLFSHIIPKGFFYNNKGVKIFNGVLMKGRLNKSISREIIRNVIISYDKNTAIDFTDNFQFITLEHLKHSDYTIAPKDFDIREENLIQINTIVDKYMHKMVQTQLSEELSTPDKISLTRVFNENMYNTCVRYLSEKITSENNHFMQSIESGSKGDKANIMAMFCAVGLQCSEGKPVELTKNKFDIVKIFNAYNNDINNIPRKLLMAYFNEKGIVFNSYARGLTERELIICAIACRGPVCASVTDTANQGYSSRQNKMCSGTTVATQSGSVDHTQLSYGDLGMNTERIMIDGQNMKICNVPDIVEGLHFKYNAYESARILSTEEIENILSFINVNKHILIKNKEIANSICEKRKNLFRYQFDNLKVSPIIFKELQQILETYLEKALIESGTAVGIIASQQIAEISVQGALDAFSTTAGENFNAGVDISKLFACTKTGSWIYTIYPACKCETLESLQELFDGKFVAVFFRNLIKDYNIHVMDSHIPEWYNDFFDVFDHSFDDVMSNDDNHSHSYIEYKLDKYTMFINKINLEKIKETIESKFADVICVWSPNEDALAHPNRSHVVTSSNEDSDYVTLRIIAKTDTVTNIPANPSVNRFNVIRAFMINVVYKNIENVLICGIEGIKGLMYVNDNDGWYIKVSTIPTKKKNCILQSIFELEEVDENTTTTNNMWDIYKCFGVESLRCMLQNTYKVDSINSIHLNLIIDFIIRRGYPLPMTRVGMSNEDVSSLTGMMFESAFAVIVNASINNKREVVNSTPYGATFFKSAPPYRLWR